MTEPEPHLDHLRDPRLAPYIASAAPAWLFGLDPLRLVWTNAAGAAVLGQSAPAAVAGRPI